MWSGFCAAWKHEWPVTTSKNPEVQTLWYKHQRMKLLTMMFCSVHSILRVPMFNSRCVDGELEKSMLLLALGPGSCGCTCAPGPCWGLLRGVLPLVHLESGRYHPWKWFLQNEKTSWWVSFEDGEMSVHDRWIWIWDVDGRNPVSVHVMSCRVVSWMYEPPPSRWMSSTGTSLKRRPAAGHASRETAPSAPTLCSLLVF